MAEDGRREDPASYYYAAQARLARGFVPPRLAPPSPPPRLEEQHQGTTGVAVASQQPAYPLMSPRGALAIPSLADATHSYQQLYNRRPPYPHYQYQGPPHIRMCTAASGTSGGAGGRAASGRRESGGKASQNAVDDDDYSPSSASSSGSDLSSESDSEEEGGSYGSSSARSPPSKKAKKKTKNSKGKGKDKGTDGKAAKGRGGKVRSTNGGIQGKAAKKPEEYTTSSKGGGGRKKRFQGFDIVLIKHFLEARKYLEKINEFNHQPASP